MAIFVRTINAVHVQNIHAPHISEILSHRLPRISESHMNTKRLRFGPNEFEEIGYSKSFRALSHRILTCANQPILRLEFLREVTQLLFDFSGCNHVQLLFKEGADQKRFFSAIRNSANFYFDVAPDVYGRDTRPTRSAETPIPLEQIRWSVMHDYADSNFLSRTRHGSYWTTGEGSLSNSSPAEKFFSLACIPLIIGSGRLGLLELHSAKYNFFSQPLIESYEELGYVIAFALAHRRTTIQLRERVKELGCLYGIAHLATQPGKTLDETLQHVAQLLPPAWLYPEIATARIVLDQKSYALLNFSEGVDKQSAEIIVDGIKRGKVEVVYLEKKPELDEGPFLHEERKLIDTIASEIVLIIQRRQEEEEDKSKLQDQLRHADRLATIGLLAAGVAHEINEPLGNILGFAQLAKKEDPLSQQVRQDVEKIITATLHAREVMKKLMLFARQMPPKKMKVNLNDIVKEGLYFLEARAQSAGIEMVHHLATPFPEVTADPTQLFQVLVNLVVNALQAMPNGGTLTVETKSETDHIVLIVEDTGIGMSDDVLKQIFIPFFTTKDVGEGTGLGLSVVHGIVTSHGGTISVQSSAGKGTRFEIQLPLAMAKKVEVNS